MERFIILVALILAILFDFIQAATTEAPSKELIYGLISPNCWTQLFVNHAFDMVCIKMVFVKLLGYGIVFASAIVKLPQIFNIVHAKSTKGLADVVLYMEMLGCMTAMFYSIHYGQPFSAYGETVFITIQSAMILVLLWHYNSQKYPLKVSISIALGYLAFGLILYDGSLLTDTMWSCVFFSLTQLSKAFCCLNFIIKYQQNSGF